MSLQRVIRPAARRTPAGARSLLWTAAAAALPVIVVVLVLIALTLAGLLFTARGFDSLFPVVAVEWLVVTLVPLSVDEIGLGFLPVLPALIYVTVLARQTRSVLSDIDDPGPREAGAAVTGVALANILMTVLAHLVVGSADSDFAVLPASVPGAIGWTLAVAVTGAGLGVWLYFRAELRESIPLWVRGGLHLGAAFVASVWALASVLVLIGLVGAWGPVGTLLEIGDDVVGMSALTAISVAYLPNLVAAASAILVGGEAHLGEASFSVFAVSRGPLPEVPLAGVLPTTNPHWSVQLLLVVTALVAALLSRSVAHWFRSTADAVRAAWLAAAVVALVMAVTPVAVGGGLGVLGEVGTGALIASGASLAVFGVIGSATIALSLAGLTRRRERAENELERRRRRAGVATPERHPAPVPGRGSGGDDDEADAGPTDGDPDAGPGDRADSGARSSDDEAGEATGAQPDDAAREPDTDVGSESASDAEPETGPEPEAESETDAEPEPETELEAEAEAEAETDEEPADPDDSDDPAETADPGDPDDPTDPDDTGSLGTPGTS